MHDTCCNKLLLQLLLWYMSRVFRINKLSYVCDYVIFILQFHLKLHAWQWYVNWSVTQWSFHFYIQYFMIWLWQYEKNCFISQELFQIFLCCYTILIVNYYTKCQIIKTNNAVVCSCPRIMWSEQFVCKENCVLYIVLRGVK